MKLLKKVDKNQDQMEFEVLEVLIESLEDLKEFGNFLPKPSDSAVKHTYSYQGCLIIDMMII